MTGYKGDKPRARGVDAEGRARTRYRPMGKVKVPVGLEKALYHAARDDAFKSRLLEDPADAIAAAEIKLRPSELAMLSAIDGAALEAMIDSLVPANPRRRKFMGLVAAAAASLAAGTVGGSCDDDTETDQHGPDAGGNGIDTDIDGDTDTATDTATDADSDTVDTETDVDTATQGVKADVEVDGLFGEHGPSEREE